MFNDKAPEELNNQDGEKLIVNEPNKEYEQVFKNVDDNQKNTRFEESDRQTDFLEIKNQGFEEKKINIDDSDIHYMPDKFLIPKKIDKKKKNIFLILAIILLILIVVSVGAFAFFALRSGKDSSDVLNLEEDIVTGDEIDNDFDDVDLTTETGRDLKRMNDILEIRGALSFYYNDIGKYPYRLSSLTKYLSEIPSNPEPGGENYYYEVEGDGKSYILTFVLENSGNFGNLVLESGKYELSSNFGVSAYNDDPEPDPEFEPDPEPDPEFEPDPEPDLGLLPIPPTGDDDDDDGLTNVEELLFGTKFSLPDSDFDGYSDGEELVSLYDPLNDGAKLINNIRAVSIYNNDIFNYSILYPTKWSVEETSTDFSETIFYDDEDGDFFKIQVNENPQELTIRKWYLNFSPGTNVNDLKYFENESIVGLKTKDGFNIYIADKDKVYIVSYILVNTEELNYSESFKMFSNSFKILSN